VKASYQSVKASSSARLLSNTWSLMQATLQFYALFYVSVEFGHSDLRK